MRYSEIYRTSGTKARREAHAHHSVKTTGTVSCSAAAPAGPCSKSLLPFGYCLTDRSEARLRGRVMVLTCLFIPMAIWHFAMPHSYSGDSSMDSRTEARLLSDKVPDLTAQPRRLSANLPPVQTGWDCLNADEYWDRKNISFWMVMKSHLTMGGQDGNGCASGEGPCLKNGWLLLIYIPAMFYMFIGLAIICDEFFVPALEMFVGEFGIPPDIAGATFMAAGGSMPELFTSLIAVFDESDVGFAAIVGSAVFNVLFVIAVCTLASDEPLELTGWPLGRDCLFYIIGLGLVAVMFSVSSPKEIEWWEALILFGWYNCYCGFMVINGRLKNWVDSVWPGKDKEKSGRTSGKVAPEMGAEDPSKFEKIDYTPSLKSPSTFRSGIVKLLTQHASLTDSAGMAVVMEMKGKFREAFEKIDTDNDGCINEAEFDEFMRALGWTAPASDEPGATLWTRMPRNDDNLLDLENFRKWYMVSEARMEVEVHRVFDRLDTNGDGVLDKEEIKQALVILGHSPPTDRDLEEVYREILRTNGQSDEDDAEKSIPEMFPDGGVNYDQFERWYSQSIFGLAHHKKHETEAKEDKGFSIDWPEGEDDQDPTRSQLFWYVFTYPLCAAMYCSLPDVRRTGMEGKVRWAIAEFMLSLVWIAVFSNALYECTVVCSNTIGIPPPVSGVTIIAAGTSVPDLLSSYIVARHGEGDMAVSSSIGSNIFDITVGLPIPWMLYSFVNGGKSVTVKTRSIGFQIIVLMAMLTCVIGTVVLMNWKMNKPLGGVMFILYFVFIALALVQQFPNEEDPVLKVDW